MNLQKPKAELSSRPPSLPGTDSTDEPCPTADEYSYSGRVDNQYDKGSVNIEAFHSMTVAIDFATTHMRTLHLMRAQPKSDAS